MARPSNAAWWAAIASRWPSPTTSRKGDSPLRSNGRDVTSARRGSPLTTKGEVGSAGIQVSPVSRAPTRGTWAASWASRSSRSGGGASSVARIRITHAVPGSGNRSRESSWRDASRGRVDDSGATPLMEAELRRGLSGPDPPRAGVGATP